MARKEPVLDFEQSRKRVADYFGCDGDFFLKPLLDLEWAILIGQQKERRLTL